jgi:hypothetical protein
LIPFKLVNFIILYNKKVDYSHRNEQSEEGEVDGENLKKSKYQSLPKQITIVAKSYKKENN